METSSSAQEFQVPFLSSFNLNVVELSAHHITLWAGITSTSSVWLETSGCRIRTELVLVFTDPVCDMEFNSSPASNNDTFLLPLKLIVFDFCICSLLFVLIFLSKLWLFSLTWMWLYPCMQCPVYWFQVWGRRTCLLVQWRLRCEASLV